MKKFFAISGGVLFFVIMVALLLFGRVDSARVVVATDTHYLSSSLNDGGEAFTYMLNNSDGKLVQYCDEIFSAFSDDIVEQKPDVVILSGDLTFNGEKASHEDFVKKLDYIQSNGVQVLAIPGNHDINRTSVQYEGDKFNRTVSISASDYKDMYYNFGMAQAESVDEHSFSYLYKVNKDLYVLMLDTNAFGSNFVQDSSYEWIENQLKFVKQKHAKVISVSHQNLFAHNEQLSFGYQLYDADELLDLLNKYKVKCHLSGHIHLQHYMQDGVTEIVTSSMLVAPVQYGVIDFDGRFKYETKRVNVKAWAERNNIDNADLLGFDEYSVDFFKHSGSSRTMAQLIEANIPNDDKELLANTFAEINYCYFAGIKCDTDDLTDGINMWMIQNEFIKKYMETMLDEAEYDYNRVIVK